MPQVGNRKFAYTAAGIRQAMKAAKNMKRRPTSGRPLPRPRPGTMRPRIPNKTTNALNSVLQRKSLMDSLQKIRGDAQPNRKEYQGPVQLGPRPTRRPRPIRVPQSGGRRPSLVLDRGPNRGTRQPNPNIPGREPNRRLRPSQGQVNGIEALAGLSQQFSGLGQGGPIGSNPTVMPNMNLGLPKRRTPRLRFPRN